jgi:hypothetical protein
MRRCIHLFIGALSVCAMMMLLALPSYAQGEGDYADVGEGAYAEDYAPRDRGPSYERPYVAYSFAPKHKPYYDDGKADYRGARYDYEGGYKPGYGAYSYYPKKRYHYPRSRKACVYGPLREKKVCDYEPRHCWKERECYYIYGKKYCRYFTKCKGGERRCYWTKKRWYGGSSCDAY